VIKPALQDDAFLADVAATRDDRSDTFRLWWLGQSGFLLQWQDRHLLIDPYLSDSLTEKYAATDKPHVRMTQRVVAPERLNFINIVTSSHAHTDHLDPDTLRPIMRANPQARLVTPLATRELAAERAGVPLHRTLGMRGGVLVEHLWGFDIAAVPAAHEAVDRDREGNAKYLGYLFTFGPWCIYHSGDTIRYEGLVEELRRTDIDVAILPINGRAPERRVAGNLSGKEAAQLAKDVDARLVIPCHYDMFEFNTASPEEFVAECERLGQPYRVLRAGERFSSSELPGIAAPGSGPR
jgi:L-ascorbate metabolism protein UlaG (beta-lactamase superfamily)